MIMYRYTNFTLHILGFVKGDVKGAIGVVKGVKRK